MDEDQNETEPFLIGLTMAGAVSAGAFTAGVLDYLFRAIDAHNAALAPPDAPEDDPRPRHRVAVAVMSGASAGGVCAGLTLASLIERQAPGEARLLEAEWRQWPVGATPAARYRVTLPPLHAVWVELVDLWTDEGVGLLGRDDLDGENAPLRSLLNGRHLDDAADRALEDIDWGYGGDTPTPGKKFDFLTRDLELFVTTTNLMGVPYQVDFTGAAGGKPLGHRMAQHSTVVHFRAPDIGDHAYRSAWLDRWGDEGITLPLPTTPGGRVPFVPVGAAIDEADEAAVAWNALKIASIATGAFPVGLPPRVILAEARDFGRLGAATTARGGAMPIEIDPLRTALAQPDLGGLAPSGKTPFVAVDGGAANNEPFEYARFTLRELTGPDGSATSRDGDGTHGGAHAYLAPNPRPAKEATRAVIMIDPFPEGPEFEPVDRAMAEEKRTLLASFAGLLPALINQARFKPSALVDAAATNVHSRFLVRPARPKDPAAFADTDHLGHERTEALFNFGNRAIASGAFGGFSGFFDRAFRVHDFVLGQENCKHFLSHEFTLACDNAVLRLPPGHPRRRQATCPIVFLDVPVRGGTTLEAERVEVPAWPRLGAGRLGRLMTQAQERLRLVGRAFVGHSALNMAYRLVLNLVWKVPGFRAGLKERLGARMKVVVLSGLIERDQLDGFEGVEHGLRAPVRRLAIAAVETGEAGGTFEDLVARAEVAGHDYTNLRMALDDLATRGALRRVAPLLGKPRYAHPAFTPGFWGRTRDLVV